MATTVQSAPQGPAGAGHNNPPSADKQAWLDECTSFGEALGTGAASHIEWMRATVQRAYRDEIEPEWAGEGSRSFQEGQRRRKATLGKRATLNDGKADKVRESECKKMIRIGKLAQFRNLNNGGLGVFNRALKLIGNDVSLKGELTKFMLKVMTEQLRNPDAPLDDDHIMQVVRPKETAEKGEGEFLLAAKKALEKAAEHSSWDANKRAALTSVNARIEQIGFKTRQQKEQEAKAKALEKQRKVAQAKQARAAKGKAAAGAAAA